MATVERVSGPSVAPTALPGARVTARLSPNYADGLVKGINDIGGAVQQIAQQEQEKAETAQLLEARRKLSDWERSWFDPKNPEGVYAKKGRDALGLSEAIAPDFDRVVSELSGNLRSDKARSAFQNMALSQRDSVLGRVQGYAVREHDAYVDAEFKANVANSIDMAARAGLEDRWEDAGREVDFGLKSIRAQGVIRGESADVTRLKEAEFVSSFAATTVNGFLSEGRIDKALKVMDDYQGQLTPNVENELRSRMAPMLLDSMVDQVKNGVTTGAALPTSVLPVAGAARTLREAEGVAVASAARTIGLESGGNATARNPRSSATGAGQFLDATWLQTVQKYAPHLMQGRSRADVLALRNDPDLARSMTEAYSKENARFLFNSGLPVTEETVYLAHRFGPAGAAKLLRAPPGTPVAQLVGRDVMAANPDLAGKTVASLSASHDRRAGGKGAVDGGQTVTSGPVLVATGRTSAQALRDHAAMTPNVLFRKRLEAEADRMEAEVDRDKARYERDMQEGIWETVGRGEKLSPEQAAYARDNKLDGQIEAERLRQVKGTLVQDNPRLVQALKDEALDDPVRFRGRALSQYQDQLTPETRAELLKMQNAVGDPSKMKDWSDDRARALSIVATLGYPQKPGETKAMKAQREEAMYAVNTAWRLAKEAYIRDHGKAPSGAVADALALEVRKMFLLEKKDGELRPGVDTRQFDKMRSAEYHAASPHDFRMMRAILQQRTGTMPTDEKVREELAKEYRLQLGTRYDPGAKRAD